MFGTMSHVKQADTFVLKRGTETHLLMGLFMFRVKMGYSPFRTLPAIKLRHETFHICVSPS